MLSENFADTDPVTVTLSSPAVSDCRTDLALDVSEPLRRAEDELDRQIAQDAQAAEKAYADGDPHGARIFADRMYHGIKARTPEHRDRLEAEVVRKINDGAGYFAHQGELDRELLAKKAA